MLGALVAKSLVSADRAAGEDLRYRILDSLRSFGRARLQPSDENELRERHLQFFISRAEALHDQGGVGGSDSEIRALGDDLDNLRAAVSWSAEHDPHSGLRLVGEARDVWLRRSHTEGMSWATRLLELCPEPDRARTVCLVTAGCLAVAHQDHGLARGYLEQAAEGAAALGDQLLLATAHLGLTARRAGDVSEAAQYLARAATRLAPTGDATILGIALAGLAAVKLREDPRRAMRLAGDTVGLRERTGGNYPPWTLADVDESRRAATTSLSVEIAEREWERGRQAAFTDVVGLVSGRVSRVVPDRCHRARTRWRRSRPGV